MRVKAFAASCLALLFAAVCDLPGDPARAQSALRPSPQTAAPPRPKQVVIGRGSDNRRGSRMTITSDAALNDYSAYRRGDRFYVELPNANAATAARAAGRGYSDLQVERRGQNVVLSYRVEPGARPRVEQRFNRLEVIFEVPAAEAPQAATAATAPTRAGAAAANPAAAPAARAEKTSQLAVSTPPAPARTAEPQASGTQTPRENPSTDVAAPPPPASAQLTVDEAPAATQPAPRELTQAQPPAPATNNVAAEQAGPGASLGALLMRNWAAMLVAGVLLAGLGLFAAARRTWGAAAPPPAALHTSPAVKLVEAPASTPEAAAPTVGNDVGDAAGGATGKETALAGAITGALAPRASPVTAEEVDAPEPGAKATDDVSAEVAPGAAEPHVSELAAGREKGGAALDGQASLPADLRQRLASREPSERAAALAALARFDTGESFRQICAAFDDESGDVRAAAARALYDVQGDRADSFTRALREATDSRRRHIGEAVAASGLASDAISQLTSESREKTYEAFSLLFLMAKAGEVTPLVRAVEGHPSKEVRLAVVKLLALSGQKEILPAFRRLAVRGGLPTEVRTAVMEAIYQISSQAETT